MRLEFTCDSGNLYSEEISLDESYQTYVNRVARLTLPSAYASQLQNIQVSPKYLGKEAVSFPGYSIISPPWREDSENEEFYQNLQTTQSDLSSELPEDLIIPVPPKSLHITLADLIWNDDYQDAVQKNPNFEQQLCDRVSHSFGQCQPTLKQGKPLHWQVLGLILRPRAIGVCLVPKSESDYQRTSLLRRCIYQNPDLIGLGIEQQYHFTAHITLGYFGAIPTDLKREQIVNTLDTFNQQWLETQPQVLSIHRAELRKFDDMTSYYRQPEFPLLEF